MGRLLRGFGLKGGTAGGIGGRYWVLLEVVEFLYGIYELIGIVATRD